MARDRTRSPVERPAGRLVWWTCRFCRVRTTPARVVTWVFLGGFLWERREEEGCFVCEEGHRRTSHTHRRVRIGGEYVGLPNPGPVHARATLSHELAQSRRVVEDIDSSSYWRLVNRTCRMVNHLLALGFTSLSDMDLVDEATLLQWGLTLVEVRILRAVPFRPQAISATGHFGHRP